MKKIFSVLLLSAFSVSLFAQDKGSDLKNMRFGVTVLPALNWYKPADPKKFKNEGVAARLGVLLNGEYSFGSNFAIGFGLGITSAGGKISFLDSVRYGIDDDKVLDWNATATSTTKYYKLNTRDYKASYFLVPFSLKMRTNEIGYLRYFFEPRFNLGIRKNVRADDDVTDWNSTNVVKQENLNINKDMAPVCMSVTLSGGGEYYLSGSTAFVFALGYQYGLGNTVKGTSDYLERYKNVKSTKPGSGQQLSEKFAQNGLVLSVGILLDRKSTRLNSSHLKLSRMPSSA